MRKNRLDSCFSHWLCGCLCPCGLTLPCLVIWGHLARRFSRMRHSRGGRSQVSHCWEGRLKTGGENLVVFPWSSLTSLHQPAFSKHGWDQTFRSFFRLLLALFLLMEISVGLEENIVPFLHSSTEFVNLSPFPIKWRQYKLPAAITTQIYNSS